MDRNLIEIAAGWSIIATKRKDGWHVDACYYSGAKARGTATVSSVRLDASEDLSSVPWPTLKDAAAGARAWIAEKRDLPKREGEGR
jgi:hypothetical protein